MHACRFAAKLAAGLIFAIPFAISHSAIAADQQKQGSGKIIKWVDDKGITHYGDSLPAQESGRNNSVINSQGVVVRKNIPVASQPDVNISAEQLEQARHDKALLASYTTAQEIDLARDRNLQMDEIALDGLRQRKLGVTAQLNDVNKSANAIKARKKPVPQDMAQDIKDKTAELGRIDNQIKQRVDNMEATRKRFDQEKQRFIELKSGKATASTLPLPSDNQTAN